MSVDEISTPTSREASQRPRKSLAALARMHPEGLHHEWNTIPEDLHCGYHIDLDEDAPKILFFNLWGDDEYDNNSVCGIVCDACDWPIFLKSYMKVSGGLKNKVKFLSKNSSDTCSQWITIEAVKRTVDGGKRLVIRDHISSTEPAVDYRYSAYFLFDDPILDEAVIQADQIF